MPFRKEAKKIAERAIQSSHTEKSTNERGKLSVQCLWLCGLKSIICYVPFYVIISASIVRSRSSFTYILKASNGAGRERER